MISSTKMCAEEVKTGFHGDNIRVLLFFLVVGIPGVALTLHPGYEHSG